ncbi:MAG: ABC transporter permease, partial [Candidatus Cellulosilyticum pullistercoris]|nr:ABC transporter permease [Candidatus Cellulosilyticum pullistercoris]
MSTNELIEALWVATKETFYMVGISMLIAIVVGTVLGLILYITSSPLLYPNKVINAISGFVINVIRSIPFIILLVLLYPFTEFLLHTTIGAKAVT